MISIYNLKPKFQSLLQPLLNKLHTHGVSANQITLFAILFSFFTAWVFWSAASFSLLFLFLPVALFIRMALNALDGMMARQFNQQSIKGEILNEVGDIVSDTAIFFPLLRYEPAHLHWVVLFIVLSIINEFAGVLAKAISGQRRYDGPMGKSDRAFFIGAYGLLAFLGYTNNNFTGALLIIVSVLLLISTVVRLWHIEKDCQKNL